MCHNVPQCATDSGSQIFSENSQWEPFSFCNFCIGFAAFPSYPCMIDLGSRGALQEQLSPWLECRLFLPEVLVKGCERLELGRLGHTNILVTQCCFVNLCHTSKPLKKLYRTSLPGPDSCHLLKPNGWHGMDFFAVVSCFKSLKMYKHHLPEQLVLLSLVGCVLSCSCITQRPASVGALYCCLAQWITKILWYLMSLNASPSCQSCTCFFRRQRLLIGCFTTK